MIAFFYAHFQFVIMQVIFPLALDGHEDYEVELCMN